MASSSSRQRNPNMEKALSDWPFVLQHDVKEKYRLISRKFSGMKLFHPSVRLTNQKARRVCIRSINQSNRFISARLFLFCSRDFKVIRKSLYHSYLRNKGSGVQLGKILWSIPTETFLEFLPSRPGNKASVTNVPAPTIPMAKIELCATSASLSWDSLLRVSIILSWGLEAERRARANGTARRITGSPYCSWNKTTSTLLKSGHLISLHEGKTENLFFARGYEKSSIP